MTFSKPTPSFARSSLRQRFASSASRSNSRHMLSSDQGSHVATKTCRPQSPTVSTSRQHEDRDYRSASAGHGRLRKRLRSRSYDDAPRSTVERKNSRESEHFPSSSHLISSSDRGGLQPHFHDLPLEWWERSDACKDAKLLHTDKIDYFCSNREDLVLQTTLWKESTSLEPNMFPYDTPPGVLHYTLWSIYDLSHREIVRYVDSWLVRNMPWVRRWQYDDNSGDRSILLFHVHVYIETDPFSFTPRHGMEYFPPHCH